MGLRRHVFVPDCLGTLGGMVRGEIVLRSVCSRCGQWRSEDPWEFSRLLGEDCTLWDCRPPCHDPDCEGELVFLASPAAGTPLRPLASEGRPTMDALPAQAWMPGWFGDRGS